MPYNSPLPLPSVVARTSRPVGRVLKVRTRSFEHFCVGTRDHVHRSRIVRIANAHSEPRVRERARVRTAVSGGEQVSGVTRRRFLGDAGAVAGGLSVGLLPSSVQRALAAPVPPLRSLDQVEHVHTGCGSAIASRSARFTPYVTHRSQPQVQAAQSRPSTSPWRIA